MKTPIYHNRCLDAAGKTIRIPTRFDLGQEILAVGALVGDSGVFGKPVQLDLNALWSQNITLTTPFVDIVATSIPYKTLASGKPQPRQLITHHLTLNEVVQSNRSFGDAMKEQALQGIIINNS